MVKLDLLADTWMLEREAVMEPTDVALEITTSSSVIDPPPWPSPALPTITMDGAPLPAPQTSDTDTSGYQVVVIDPGLDITAPSSIIANKYIPLFDNEGWVTTYPLMYDEIVETILTAGNVGSQLVFVVSFGMDQNAPPTTLALQTMLGLGAGPELQNWELNCSPGSMDNGWVGLPWSYIFVGGSGWDYGQGFEVSGKDGQTTLTATLQNNVPPSS